MSEKKIIKKDLIFQDEIEQLIFAIRGFKVMIDRDLAHIYGVETKYLNRQVKRNIERFPEGFMFKLTTREKDELVTKWHRFKSMKHSSSLPYVFTEHGVAMLASVLKSKKAVKMSIHIVKVFIKLRQILLTHKELSHKIAELEKRMENKDQEMQTIFNLIRQLITPQSEQPKPRIGFHAD